MTNKTRKNFKNNKNNKHNNAKKATQLKCRMKTCRAKKYQAIYGSAGGSIRSTRQLFY